MAGYELLNGPRSSMVNIGAEAANPATWRKRPQRAAGQNTQKLLQLPGDTEGHVVLVLTWSLRSWTR